MKDCKNIHPLLSLDLEGVLSQKEKAQVEKHLAFCITARREKEQFERMRKALQGLPEPPVPADLHGRIMSRLGLATREAPKVIPWKRPFLLAAAMLLVVVFMDRLPEWKEDALRPDPENFAPQPATSSMEREVPSRDLARRDVLEKKKETRASGKRAPGKVERTSQEKDLGQAEGAAQGNLGRLATDAAADQGMEEAAPAQPSSAVPSAKSAAAPEALFQKAEEPTQSNEAERDMNTLKLSKEVSGLVWRGNNGIKEGTYEELVTDPKVFQALWAKLRPGQRTPEVDFGKDSVLYLEVTTPSLGHHAVITDLEERAGTLAVHYKVQLPAPYGGLDMMGEEWILQVIPKPTKPVTFIREK